MCFVISNAYRSFPGSYSLFLKSGEEDIFVVTSVPKIIAIFLKVMVININFRTKMIFNSYAPSKLSRIFFNKICKGLFFSLLDHCVVPWRTHIVT